MVTIGLSHTVSEINDDVRRKLDENRQFSHPRVFNTPDKGVTLGIWYRRKGSRMLLWWGYQMVEKVLRYLSSFWYNTGCDRQPASHPPSQTASHVAVAITLNANGPITIAIRVRFECDSSTIQHPTTSYEEPTRSYALSSNNGHVNSFAFAVRCCSQSARRRRRFCDDVIVAYILAYILARVSGDLFQFILFSSWTTRLKICPAKKI